MFLAFNMGASGTAPSFSAAFGAKLIRVDLIPGLFGLSVFAGAIIAGQKVILTVSNDILPAAAVNMNLSVIVLGSVALALFISNLLRVPQSTSQATIFALAGPAIYLDILQTQRLFFEIIPTWFITPIIAFILSYGLGKFILKPLSMSVSNDYKKLQINKTLKWFVIATSCYVAFAIGSNNMANVAAPLLAMAANMLKIETGSDDFMLLMLILVFMLAPMFGIGSSLLGNRLMATTGRDITRMGPLGAGYISVITASILLVSSLWRGIPTSLVQMNTAAIIGLGMAKNGMGKTWEKAPLSKIFIVWIVSPLIALAFSLLFTWLAASAGILQ